MQSKEMLVRGELINKVVSYERVGGEQEQEIDRGDANNGTIQ